MDAGGVAVREGRCWRGGTDGPVKPPLASMGIGAKGCDCCKPDG